MNMLLTQLTETPAFLRAVQIHFGGYAVHGRPDTLALPKAARRKDVGMATDRQMKKGVLELCLLHLIAQKETYGYDLLRRISAAFTDVNESTVYAILRRLCADGSTEAFPKGESYGPPRKYYRITPAGSARLKQKLDDWRGIADGVRRCGIE